MLHLTTVTIFHITDENTGAYEKTVHQAHVYQTTEQRPEKGGFVTSGSAKIRIPGTAELQVSVHDYLCIGEAEDIHSSKRKKIYSIRDSRKGGLPHYILEAI